MQAVAFVLLEAAASMPSIGDTALRVGTLTGQKLS